MNLSYVGEKATVCGSVVSTHYAVRTKGSPTFLNLDEPYPRHIFTILIWGSDRPKFDEPEAKYENKRVCVTGLIKDYRGVPEVIVEQPSQIEIQKIEEGSMSGFDASARDVSKTSAETKLDRSW